MKNTYPVLSFAPQTLLHKYFVNNKPAVKSKWIVSCYLFAVLLLSQFNLNARLIYVTPTGAGNHNGLSWINACTLTQAANACEELGNAPAGTCLPTIAAVGDSILLAAGNYLSLNANTDNGYQFV